MVAVSEMLARGGGASTVVAEKRYHRADRTATVGGAKAMDGGADEEEKLKVLKWVKGSGHRREPRTK